VRALKILTSFVSWRWTPCVALIGSSLLYVLIVVLVTPKSLSFGGPPSKAVNVIEGPEPTNAMTPSRGATRREPAATREAPAMVPATPLPPTPVAVPPPPPSPADEPRRVEPAPPPPPAPHAAEPGEPDEEPHAAPPPPITARDRSLAAPLRMMPQLTANPNAVAPPPPASD